MTSRTTDLSSAFVEWRAKNNMTVLKGLGAIASVSGWKAQIRKMAKERGLDELAAAGPGGSTSPPKARPLFDQVKGPTPQTETVATPSKSTSLNSTLITGVMLGNQEVLSHPDVLFGRPSKKLVVESARGMCVDGSRPHSSCPYTQCLTSQSFQRPAHKILL